VSESPTKPPIAFDLDGVIGRPPLGVNVAISRSLNTPEIPGEIRDRRTDRGRSEQLLRYGFEALKYLGRRPLPDAKAGLAAALLIFALAEPVLNPSREAALAGTGPVAIVVDNGWASASRWDERTRMIDRIIAEAEGKSRPVVIVPTASTNGEVTPRRRSCASTIAASGS